MSLMDGIEQGFSKEFSAWIRLEPRCRSNDFARGIQARTADPLWMLARQWQTGEFQAEDAGSPIVVRIKHSTQSLDRVRLGENGKVFDLPDAPLEMIVEQEAFELDWRMRVQIGQQFERFIHSELEKDDALILLKDYRDKYSLKLPTGDAWTTTDLATRRFLQLVAGRVIDGGKLRDEIGQLDPPASITPEQFEKVVLKFLDWYHKLYPRTPSSKPQAWRNQQLDYRFDLNPIEEQRPVHYFESELANLQELLMEVDDPDKSAEIEAKIQEIQKELTTIRQEREQIEEEIAQLKEILASRNLSDDERKRIKEQLKKYQDTIIELGEPKTRLVAPNYRNGALDWYTFNVASGLKVHKNAWTSQPQLTMHPTAISVGGVSPRWWTFEDANINFGRLDVAKPDLAKLWLMEFALIYGDDWFSVPLTVQTANLVRIDKLLITNVFGEETLIDPARQKVRESIAESEGDPDDPLLRWEMFTLSPLLSSEPVGVGDPNRTGVGDVLFIPPMTSLREESPAFEEARFLRDENANKVFCVERTILNGLGTPVDGSDAQRERSEREREVAIATLEAELAQLKAQLEPNLPQDELAELEAQVQTMQDELTRLREGPKPAAAGTVSIYRLATPVAANWHPFIPTHASAILNLNYPSIRLRRGQMLRNMDDEEPLPIPAMSRLLELKEDPLLWIEESAVPRSGLRVQLTAQRVRWVDGKTYVWLGRKVLTGRGEGSSGLRFDYSSDSKP